MTESQQVAFVVKEQEQQQEGEEVHEQEDKEAQDNVQAERNSHHEDGIATNIKVKEVTLQQYFVHAKNPC